MIEFRLLGPFEAWREGRAIPLGGLKQRGVLALLVLHANRVVARERLIDGLWAAHARELLGDLAGAEQDHVAKWESLREGRGHLPDARAMLAAGELAHLLCSEGRWDEAEALLVYGSDVPEPSFYRKEAVVRLAVRARIALHRGDLEGATDLAVRAVELGEQTDLLNWRGRLWETAAEAHRAAGDGGGAEDATLAATRLYTAKGNVAAVSALAT